uniref:retinitis pigmentosa 1-like 1 protein n=1 Tax=Pristiophorus japonicus TaxID=55135 RepID=UPI00398E5A44
MAVNTRTFKTFDALLDDLTQKVSLPFGVRTVTTPHGVHSINSLEQLEDGGSYLCSDKKHVKPININTAGRKPATWQGNNPTSIRRHTTQRVRQEDHQVNRIHTAHKKIILIKNGNVGIHYSIVLHKRNVHSFRSFLDEISELMQYNVRKLFTVDGRNIDTLQALFHCPNVLVCVGHEAFKPIVNPNFRRRSSEKLPGLSRRSHANVNNESVAVKKNANFGLEAKKSVIHPRSPSRSPRVSLSSDKSCPNGLNMSSSNSGYASFMDSRPHKKTGEFTDSMIEDDIEKRVHVNKDGSLSVEMKVRFRLLNRETLQWSTQIRRSSLAGKTNTEHLCSVEDCAIEQVEQRNPDNGFDQSFEQYDANGSHTSKHNGTEPEENHCENCCKHCQGYDIWKNPMYADKITEGNSRIGGHTHSSCSSTSPCWRVVYKRESVESVQTTASEEHTQHFVQQMESHSETVENGDGGVEYSSVSCCSSQSGSCTSASKTVGHHESRASISRSYSAISHCISSHSSINISHQNSNDEDLSCVSPSNSTASSKRKAAVKTADKAKADRPATSSTSLEEAPVDLKEVDSTAAGDKSVSNIAESFHCLKCNKQIKDEGSSEGRAQNVSSSCSNHSIDGCKELVALNYLCLSTASSCSTPFSGKTNATKNAGYAEEGKAYSVVSSCSLHRDKNPNREIYKDNRPASEMSLSSRKSKTDRHIKQNLNESERQSSPEVHGINYELHFQDNDMNGRPGSNTTYSSSKKSNKCTTHMDADADRADSVLSWSSTSSAARKVTPSLTVGKDGNVSCSEDLSEKNGVKLKYQPASSIHYELLSPSEHAGMIVKNSNDKSQRSSHSESINCSSSNSTSRSRKAKSEDECRPSTSVSGNSKLHFKAGEEGKTSNEDNRPTLHTSSFSEGLQIETNIKMEREKSETASSIFSTVSKASGVKAEAESQEQKQVEDELEQTGISKLSNVGEIEFMSCKVDEDTITQTKSFTENASVQNMPQSFSQKEMADGKSTPQLLTDSGLTSKSSMTTDKVTGQNPPASRPTTSGTRSNLSEKSTRDKPHKENVNKRDSDRNSEKVSSKEKCKHSNNTKKNKNKKSTHTVAVACGKNDRILGVLPNASLEQVVHEWLKKIPSENMLIKYDSTEEFQDKCEKSAIDVMLEGERSEAEATTTLEAKPCEEESTVSNQESKKKKISEMVKLENSGSPKAEGKSAGQHIVKEVDILQSKPISSCSSVMPMTNHLHEKVLSNNVHSSVEVIKVLLSSRQKVKLGRSNSLPDLNLSLERKLSHSAKALLTCIASLQFFDKESSDSANKLNNTNNSAQKELLSILKSLWFTDIAKEGEGEVSQTAGKHSKTFKGHNSADDNVTPVSSSGVDVNSGSGGSGDGSVGEATNVSLATEKKKSNLDFKTFTNKKNDASKQNQPSLMKNSFDKKSVIGGKPNEKNEEHSISSAESILANASCRKPKLRNCRNSKNKPEEIDNIEKRSLSRNSKISQSDVTPSSPVTPDIACRVQWNSDEQSNNGEDLDENVDIDTGKSPQETNQNLKEQVASDGEGIKRSAGNSCDMEDRVHQTKAKDHNEAIDRDDPEEEKIVHHKITEKCNSTGRIKTPQQITLDHCCAAQAVIADQEPVPTQRKLIDPDPVWLLKLLKKMEKQFITHYVDAMNEFKIKWNLEDSDRLEQMIEDLREDVGKRIHGTIASELKKVQGRAGRSKPLPPQEPRRSESSEQTDQRRRRLKAITNDISSLISDEDSNFSEILGGTTNVHEQFNLDKFCPCDSCMEKCKAPKLATNAKQTNIPIVKDFDLREILRMKMNRCNEQITKPVTDTDGPEELLDREINKHGENKSMEPVQNKIEHLIRNDEPVNENQENVNVNDECENHKLNQGEEKVPTGNHAVGPNLEDIDEKEKQPDKCEDDLEDKSEGGRESPNIKPNEDKEDDVFKDENQHRNDKEMPENDTRDTAENNNRELDEAKNLDDDISELSDEHVKSNAVKSQNEKVIEDMNAKLPEELSASLDVISCPQQSDERMPEDSAKEDTDGDIVQINTKEATSSSSNSPGNKSSQMYPESSSDEDSKSICSNPEASENNSDPDTDQKASMRNISKNPGQKSEHQTIVDTFTEAYESLGLTIFKP